MIVVETPVKTLVAEINRLQALEGDVAKGAAAALMWVLGIGHPAVPAAPSELIGHPHGD